MKKSEGQNFGSDAFWRRFSREIWEKKSYSAKNITSPILEIDADVIFKMLVEYCDRCRKRADPSGIKLFVDGQLQYPEETLDWLPIAQDKNLAGYHRRMANRFDDYGLVCDELLQVAGTTSDILTHFIQRVCLYTGLPHRFAEVGLYLGNYRKTPFGVHVDSCGVMSFPVVGKKTFRVWPQKYVDKNPDLKASFQYDVFKKGSTILTASPGDFTYWPSSYWHIAESDGSFHATWSIGFWMDRSLSDVVWEVLESPLSQLLGDRADLKSTTYRASGADGRVDRLPDNLRLALATLRKIVAEAPEDMFLRFWLRLASQKGRKNFPPPFKQQLRRSDWVRGVPEQPILWARLSDGKTCLGVNGQLIEIAANSKAVIPFVRALNLGKDCELARLWTPRLTPLFQALYQNRAMVKVTAP